MWRSFLPWLSIFAALFVCSCSSFFPTPTLYLRQLLRALQSSRPHAHCDNAAFTRDAPTRSTLSPIPSRSHRQRRRHLYAHADALGLILPVAANVLTKVFTAQCWMRISLYVYLPVGYFDQTPRRYPVFISFWLGRIFSEWAHTASVPMDRSFKRRLQPMIIVMPSGNDNPAGGLVRTG